MWKNLEPRVIRQRLIIEGLLKKMPTPDEAKNYLLGLSEVSKMKVVIEPHGNTDYPGGGIAFWIHWSTSGAHFYSYYSAPNNRAAGPLKHPLFTLDTYTCKPFDVKKVIEFTRRYFKPVKIVWKEIKF